MAFGLSWERLQELPGFLPGMAALAALAVLSALSALEPADRIYYDAIVEAIPQPASARHQVLLVESAPGERHDWRRLSEQLFAAGARQIVFVFPLEAEALKVLAGSSQRQRLLVGRPLVENREKPGTLEPAPLAAPEAGQLQSAVAGIPPDALGFFRSQMADYPVGDGDKVAPSIEKAAALDAGRPEPPERFLINFHRGYHLPRLGADRLEREGVVPEMAADRTILVGYAPSPYLARFNAPGLPKGTALSQLEFHGLALDTLLQDRWVRAAGPLGRLVIIILFGLTLILAFQPLRLFSGFWVTVALLLALPLHAWLSLRLFDVWPPAFELSAAAILTLILVYRGKAKADDRRLSQILVATSVKLENRLVPLGFAESREHWIFVTSMVDQVLQLDRTIFLERIPGDHRVREIQALRCSLDDIDEMRRDYTRQPYTDAIERGQTIEIDPQGRRPYLKVRSPEDRQFLAPLTFGGEVLGFWAFALAAERIGDPAQFRAMANALASQIGHLLYRRLLWQERQADENRPWRRYLSDDATGLYRRLSRSIVALEQRVSGFEKIFAELSTAAIVFDPFGRVLLVNDLMSQLLTRAGIAPFEMTAADLMERLTGRSPDSIRQTIQAILRDGTPATFQASLPGRNPGRFILYAHALPGDTEVERNPSSTVTGDGFLLELIDVGELHRLYGIKSDLVRYLNHQLNNDLATMLGALQLLKSNPAAVGEMLDVINAQGREAARTLDRVQDLLGQEVDVDYGGSYPVDPRTAIEGALESLRASQAEREISFDLAMQPTPFLVYANPRELDDTLAVLLGFLADDAVEGSTVKLGIKVFPETTELVFANTGFGLPQDRLDGILAGTVESSPKFEKLRLALQRVEKWGGSAALRTGLGEGFVITLHLRTFS